MSASPVTAHAVAGAQAPDRDVDALRDEASLRKRPSTSELIDWIAALRRAGLTSKDLDRGLPFLGVLLKREQDLVQLAERQAGGRGRA